MRVFGDANLHNVLITMSPQQHLPHGFRILGTQVSPVLLNLFNYAFAVVFIPIFDRFVSFDLACNATTLFLTVSLVVGRLFDCLHFAVFYNIAFKYPK